jgi:uncharacterized protein
LTDRITTTAENLRRIAVTKQHLAGEVSRSSDDKDILNVFRDIGCVQLDPISTVAPSHLIVLWSRLGNFDKSQLDKLLWRDKRIFEYWAHQASLVLMEDYPLYYSMMRGFPESFARPWGPGWAKRNRLWMTRHANLKEYVLRELRQKGSLLSRQFEESSSTRRHGSGWGSSSELSWMLMNLLFRGDVMVVGRQGNQKLWGLTEQFLPHWVSKSELSMDDVEQEAVQRSIRALGIANASEIKYYFLRGRYRNLKTTLKQLLGESKILLVDVEDGQVGNGDRYIHANDIPLLERLESDGLHPRLTLLSPFDNLICDRTRTRLLFNFDYTVEIYTPPHKRKYGYYVLPILYGDRLIGRLDPAMDRKKQTLHVKAVHAEGNAPREKEVAEKLSNTISQFAEFLGANEVVYSRRVPSFWRTALR